MSRWFAGPAAALCLAVLAPAQEPTAKPKPPAPAGPADLVRKAIAAHGGADLLGKLRAGDQQTKGKIALPGGEGEFTGSTVYELPDKYRMTLDLDLSGGKDPVAPKISLAQVVNGRKMRTTLNGQPQKMTDAQKGESLQAMPMLEMIQLAPLVADKTRFKLKPADPVTVAGKPADGVVVSADGVKDVTLYFDAATGLLVKTARKGISPGDEKEVLEEAVMSDYRPVNGVQVAGTAVVTHDGKPFMTVTQTGAKLSEKAANPKDFEIEN